MPQKLNFPKWWDNQLERIKPPPLAKVKINYRDERLFKTSENHLDAFYLWNLISVREKIQAGNCLAMLGQ